MTFLDTINTIDDMPDSGTLGIGQFWWFHGVNKSGVKAPGVFYVKSTELATIPKEPWITDTRFENEEGYSTHMLNIAVIGYRSQWFIPSADRKGPKNWITGYEDGAQKQVEILCFAEGIDDPLVLAAAGVNKGGKLNNILNIYRNGLLKDASRKARRGLPMWTFWLPIRGQMENGKPVFTPVKDKEGNETGAVVTPPTLYLPADPMETLFVGEEMMRRGAEVYNQYANWSKQRHLPFLTVEGEIVPPKQLMAPDPDDGDYVPF